MPPMSVTLFTHPDMIEHRPGVGHPERPERLKAVLDALDDSDLSLDRRAATEAAVAVPPDAGVVTTRRSELRSAVAGFLASRERAEEAGAAARRHALQRYGLQRFLRDWDTTLDRVLAGDLGGLSG